MKKILLFSSLALIASFAPGQTSLLNFHGTDLSGAYNPGGLTFNNISYGVDSVNPADTFSNVSGLALLNSAGLASGVTFDMTVTSGAGGFLNSGASQSVFDTAKPATGFEWYDTSSANLRETGVMADSGSIVYTFSGFNASDSVTFQFVLGRSGTGTRRIDFGPSDALTGLLNAANTASVAYFLETTLTGGTSYSFVATRGDTGDAASSFVGAASLTVIPEPSTYALIGGSIVLGLVTLRRRRKA